MGEIFEREGDRKELENGMSGWQECKLGEQINLKRGYDLPNRLRQNGEIPIYSSSGITGFHSEKMCEAPGVITGRYGTIGKIFFSNTHYWPLNTTLYIQDFKGNDELFFYYFLQRLDWEKYSDKSAVPGINRNDVHQEDIVIPPLLEQKAIASILSSLDDKIDLLHRQNRTLEAISETLFRQWFIEELHEYWEKKPLSTIADFLNGLACQKLLPKNDIEKLPVLKIRELKGGIGDDCDYATTDVSSEYVVNDGDVIFAWSASLMVKIWHGQTCVLNQHLFKVTSREFPKWFYYHWCKFHLDEFIAISQAHATTMGHIKRGDLDAAIVTVPSKDELKKMNDKIAPIFSKIEINGKQIHTLEKLRDNLLPKLMSGEVRVET
jgi:type I restriction enzyme, S subunit